MHAEAQLIERMNSYGRHRRQTFDEGLSGERLE